MLDSEETPNQQEIWIKRERIALKIVGELQINTKNTCAIVDIEYNTQC